MSRQGEIDCACIFNKCSLDRSLLSERQNCGSQMTYKNLRSCSWKLACQEEIWLVKHNKHTRVSGVYVTIIYATELTCQLCHLGDKSMIKPLCVDFIWRVLFFPADRGCTPAVTLPSVSFSSMICFLWGCSWKHRGPGASITSGSPAGCCKIS